MNLLSQELKNFQQQATAYAGDNLIKWAGLFVQELHLAKSAMLENDVYLCKTHTAHACLLVDMNRARMCSELLILTTWVMSHQI